MVLIIKSIALPLRYQIIVGNFNYLTRVTSTLCLIRTYLPCVSLLSLTLPAKGRSFIAGNLKYINRTQLSNGEINFKIINVITLFIIKYRHHYFFLIFSNLCKQTAFSQDRTVIFRTSTLHECHLFFFSFSCCAVTYILRSIQGNEERWWENHGEPFSFHSIYHLERRHL